MNINQYIDHTLLKPTTTIADIEKLCNEAITHNFYAICINSCHVSYAKIILGNGPVKIASVIGFPLGANTTKSKIFEANDCINIGATEVDMVLNIGLLKSGSYQLVEDEIYNIKKTIGSNTLKVIFENCYLTTNEKIIACKIALNTGADYIKTSTGFGTGGATVDDIKLMKSTVKDQVKIKASGGIKNFETAKKYLDLGVSRIGTSSGVTIMNQK
jgi:deoxyribose-phosphate aldolase